jgi:hypothetical protein
MKIFPYLICGFAAQMLDMKVGVIQKQDTIMLLT